VPNAGPVRQGQSVSAEHTRPAARKLVSRGAARVYGAALNPAAVTEPGVTPMGIDITDPARVAGVAHECAGVTLLVNIGLSAEEPPCGG
jgi:hypothetical protein